MPALADSGASGIVDVFDQRCRPATRPRARPGERLGPNATRDDRGADQDDRGAAFADARVLVDEFGEMRSGADGRVVLRNVPAGTRQVEVLAIGRLPVSVVVELAAGDTATFTASLRRITTLDVVRVTGTRRQRRMVEEFESRRQNGAGYVLDPRLAQRGRLSSAFEGFPSVEVRSTRGQFSLTFPGPRGDRCVPVVFIDGRKTDVDELNMLRIGEIAAVEVYPRRASAPAEFLANERCGSVVVWTRWLFELMHQFLTRDGVGSQLPESASKVGPRIHVFRIELERDSELLRRLRHAPELRERDTPVQVRVGIRGRTLSADL